MSNNENSNRIEELRTQLKNDWQGRYRKYPDQAAFALSNSRVTTAIEKRFDKNGTIKEIRSLDYDFYGGLNRICFEFNPITMGTGLPSPDAILVIMDSNCNIVGIVDPFDPVQPNRHIPPLPPKEGEQPFVLSRPSKAEELTFNEQEMTAVQIRGRQFFERLASGGSTGTGWPGNIIHTTCDYTTHVACGYRSDRTNDDCGMEDYDPCGILV
jgi:hypothetical protein